MEDIDIHRVHDITVSIYQNDTNRIYKQDVTYRDIPCIDIIVLSDIQRIENRNTKNHRDCLFRKFKYGDYKYHLLLFIMCDDQRIPSSDSVSWNHDHTNCLKYPMGKDRTSDLL